MAILFLSQGVPMILAGDEVLHSQRGNNNCYCQNNALSWFDWRCRRRGSDMLRFVGELIALRQRHASLRRATFPHWPGLVRTDSAGRGLARRTPERALLA